MWGGGWGRDRCPQESGPPAGVPGPGQGREPQAVQSLGTSSPRAHAQQASSSSHINTDTLNKNSISSSQGIKTSLEYVQQRAWGGQARPGSPGMRQAMGGAEERGPKGSGPGHSDLAAPLPRLNGGVAQICLARQDWPLQPASPPPCAPGSPFCPSCLR